MLPSALCAVVVERLGEVLETGLEITRTDGDLVDRGHRRETVLKVGRRASCEVPSHHDRRRERGRHSGSALRRERAGTAGSAGSASGGGAAATDPWRLLRSDVGQAPRGAAPPFTLGAAQLQRGAARSGAAVPALTRAVRRGRFASAENVAFYRVFTAAACFSGGAGRFVD